VTKSTDKHCCLREVYCEIYIALWSENITKLIRYKSRGNNPVKPFKSCTGFFWLIWKLGHSSNTGNKPAGDHCAVWGWFNDKWVRVTHAVWLLCCSKPLFCFYKHIFQWFSFSITDQGWLLEYISECWSLKVPFYAIILSKVWYWRLSEIARHKG